ncbi:MAG: amino acid-binding protein [Candidatus Kerfeldbacteria bacterium RIFCSPHIGHO2_02_FULL_42_14]|uniref:Amino acid-binding protein n=1 Tax=Candidatus Kerfeldbacteria bacterium RIFCSPHIGHO2_02_FULL_42_14 TaxID=1798540 RepID=A0A1G2AQA3_9BACT|nr:MAG: amino acid-binding protein [Candidatus Kerfeldbacteria bacterium RIFCSPHIGHO2_02_FULL_42_14]OGY80713.1 MAG: amino acid-binding protein [Candidatus Kerfeldbacteria bacterium RIFCSPHIGHO2_12_FULL_42_13]OGY82639.1 MAG: amino acid-binding protein [Candidatus Kerfeldbacteria bacterium RIFCSPLOWO2_02_FULL_42_19]OGY85243.1 MAG: amino acid-binding protein [Candidatus Kerfeldbacteria bacterium RIFCSPLOWO2_12_FULL_43_9]
MSSSKLSLKVLPMKVGICRLEKEARIPDWAIVGGFFSVTRTDDELSVVCMEENIPEDVKCEKGWRVFKVEGILDFSLTGILASIANPLAQAKISIFAVSTFDTDYILVKEDTLEEAVKVLSIEFSVLK